MLSNNKNSLKPLAILTLALLYTDNAIAKKHVDIPAIDCMIEPNVLVELSSPVAGVLDTLTVDKSDEVKKGQVIATLKSDIEQVDVKSSREKLKLSTAEYKRAAELYREKAITKSEKEQLDNNKKLAELELKHAKTSLDLRKIKSPIDGIVVKRYANPGEFVETKPILQLAQLNPLRIEVVSPVANYGNIVKGMQARIAPEFGEYNDLVAKVVVVDKVVDAASGTFSVRLELENKDHSIPGGLKCSAKFMPKSQLKVATAVKKIDPVKIKPAKKTINESISKPVNKSTSAVVKDNVNKPISKYGSNKTSLKDTSSLMLCSTFGPYKKQSTITKLSLKLKNKAVNTKARVEQKNTKIYRVVSKYFKSKSEAAYARQQIQETGFSDIAYLKSSNNKRLAFGVFSTNAAAKKRMQILKDKGFDTDVVEDTTNINMHFMDIVHDTSSATMVSKLTSAKYQNTCSAITKLSLTQK